MSGVFLSQGHSPLINIFPGLDLLSYKWDDILAAFFISITVIYLVREKIIGNGSHYHLWFERPQAHLTTKAEVAESNIAKALRASGQEIVVFYGSQSGTSQRLAQNLRQAIDRHFSKQICVASLSDYDSSSIAEISRQTLVIFILSTYGEGDPPDNAFSFSEWLQSDGLADCLDGLQFSMLGLGCSNYKSYNQFARSSFDLLISAGATPVLDLHLADDALGLFEEDYFSWATNLFQVLIDKFGLQEQPRKYQPSLEVRLTDDIAVDQVAYVPSRGFEGRTSRASGYLGPIYRLPVKNTCCLTSSPDRPVLHLEFDISAHPKMKYATGDHLAIWPQNEEDEVQNLSERLGISAVDMTKILSITRAHPDAAWDPPQDGAITLQTLLKRHLEIAAPLSREFIQSLEQFAPTAAAKSFLQSVSSDRAKYVHYRETSKITFGSVLQDACPNEVWPIPLAFILENIPVMRPRYYSIASASSVSPRQVAVTVSLNTLQLKNSKQVIKGLTSHYLLNNFITRAPVALKERIDLSGSTDADPTAVCRIRKSRFRLPALASQPMIMVVTGSGIAPFRGFI